MATQMKTPGVYIVEKDAFPNSVVAVATAVPAFVGYTQKAIKGTKSLLNVPTKVSSFSEYVSYFGGAPASQFAINKAYVGSAEIIAGPEDALSYYSVALAGTDYKMYYSMKLFFENGGGDCYVVSVGDYNSELSADALAGTGAGSATGVKTLVKETEPTMLVIPDAVSVSMDAADCKSVQDQMVAHCGEMTNRMALLDVYEGYQEEDKDNNSVVENFRNSMSETLYFKYAAAYYPWLNTSIISETNIGVQNLSSDQLAVLQGLLKKELGLDGTAPLTTKQVAQKAIVDSITTVMGGSSSGVPAGGSSADIKASAVKKAAEEVTRLTALKAKVNSSSDPTKAVALADVDDQLVFATGVKTGVAAAADMTAAKAVVTTSKTAVATTKKALDAAQTTYNQSVVAYEAASDTYMLDGKTAPTQQQGKVTTAQTALIGAQADYAVAQQNLMVANQVYRYFGGVVVVAKPSIEAINSLNQNLSKVSTAYNQMVTAIAEKINLLPPCAAMAGVMTAVDNTRGVWKAPANVGVASTLSPAVKIDNKAQEDLNMPMNGRAVNAIRSFIGEGVLVWGARTLDGNSQDWRYVNVKRTLIMLEQSIKNASKAFVFEPNDAKTWVSMKSMIDNFLTNMWTQGALVGAKPNEAFSVSVGLGSTMTANDILDGIMRITILVAISHPAEFIEITFQQEMQKS